MLEFNENLSIDEYNKEFNSIYEKLKNDIYIKSDTIVHTIKDSILTLFTSSSDNKSEVNDFISKFNIGENYIANQDSFDITKALLVIYFIVGNYETSNLNNQVKREIKGSEFGCDILQVISDLLSIESNSICSCSDIKLNFSRNTGLVIRDINFNEYVDSNLYINDIITISRLYSDEYQSVTPYLSKINSVVDEILESYDKMFSSGFDLNKPFGVFTEDSFLFVKNKKLVVQKLKDVNNNPTVSIEKMLVSNELGSQDVGFVSTDSYIFDFNSVVINKSCNYIPKLLLYFALGCTPSGNDSYIVHPEYGGDWKRYSTKIIRPYLVNTVFKQCTEIYVQNGKQYDEILSMYEVVASTLKNCCLVLEWNTDLAVKIRLYTSYKVMEAQVQVGNCFVAGVIARLFNSIFNNVGEIIDNSNGNLLDFKLVKDIKAYNFEPIFAYQALDGLKASNRLPSWENVILGRLENDKTFTFDFSKYWVYHVVAESRAGKGVMCLNLVAAVLGSAYPLAYLDCKPDMSKAIFNLCNKAVTCDAMLEDELGVDTSKLISSLSSEAQVLLGSNYTNYGGIVYAKLLQLMFLIAELRFYVKEHEAKGITEDELGTEIDKNSGRKVYSRLVVFADELEKATMRLNDTIKICIDRSEPFSASKKEIKENAGEDGELLELSPSAPAYAVLANKIVKWEKQLGSDIYDSSKATWGKSRMHIIAIYQSYNQTNDAKEKHKYEHIFANLQKFPSKADIIGSGANYYPEPALKVSRLSSNLTKSKRWFSLSTVASEGTYEAQSRTIEALDKGNLTLFKPYLILNDSNINAPCVQEFLDNNQARIKRFTKDGAGTELIDSRIGFESYVNDMLTVDNTGNTVESLLNKGNVIATAVVNKLGYSSVNDYLFDFSINSFKSVSELKDLIGNGLTIHSKLDDAVSVSQDEKFKFKEIEREQVSIENKPLESTPRGNEVPSISLNTSVIDRSRARQSMREKLYNNTSAQALREMLYKEILGIFTFYGKSKDTIIVNPLNGNKDTVDNFIKGLVARKSDDELILASKEVL